MSLWRRKTRGALRLLRKQQREVMIRLDSGTQPQGGGQLAPELPRGRCLLTVYAPDPASFSGGRLTVSWAGNDIEQIAFDGEVPASRGWFVCELVLPVIAEQVYCHFDGNASNTQPLLLQWSPARRRAQLFLLLQGVLRRLPAIIRQAVQRIWLRRLQRRKPRHSWGWEQLIVLNELDRKGMRKQAAQEGWVKGHIRIWVDAQDFQAGAAEITLRSLQQNVVDIFAVGLIGGSDDLPPAVERVASLAEAMAATTEDWFAVVPAGCRVAPAAGYWLAPVLATDAAVFYTDAHDADAWPDQAGMILAGDFDPELFREEGTLPGLVGVRRKALGGFSALPLSDRDSWPDCVRRVVEQCSPGEVAHIDQVLLSLRSTGPGPLSTKGLTDRLTTPAEGWGQVRTSAGGTSLRPRLPDPVPRVAVVIPTRDRADLLRICIGSLLDITQGVELEVCIADNDSVEAETREYFADLRARGVQIQPCPGEFNFSRIVNQAVAATQAEYVLLLNNDIEVIEPDWLVEMLAHGQRPEIGCVGAKLFFPDGRIQHAGVTIGLGGLAGHPMRFYPGDSPGYLNRLHRVQSYRAVTAACLLVRRDIFDAVGGFNEPDLAVAYNDVDFCLRVEQAGYRNVWTPHARLVHHEYASRGLDTDPVKAARYARECDYLREHWNTTAQVDPYYPRLLTRADETCSLADEPWGPRPWLVTICNDA